jgi:hypothetical protein
VKSIGFCEVFIIKRIHIFIVVDGDRNSIRKSIDLGYLAEITATKLSEVYVNSMHVIYSFNLHKTWFQIIV